MITVITIIIILIMIMIIIIVIVIVIFIILTRAVMLVARSLTACQTRDSTPATINTDSTRTAEASHALSTNPWGRSATPGVFAST